MNRVARWWLALLVLAAPAVAQDAPKPEEKEAAKPKSRPRRPRTNRSIAPTWAGRSPM